MLIMTASSVLSQVRPFLPLPSVCEPATCTVISYISPQLMTARLATALVESTSS